MNEDEILDVIRTSTTWTEVDDRLAEWNAAQAWWKAQPWPGQYKFSDLCNAGPARILAQFRKYGPNGTVRTA